MRGVFSNLDDKVRPQIHVGGSHLHPSMRGSKCQSCFFLRTSRLFLHFVCVVTHTLCRHNEPKNLYKKIPQKNAVNLREKSRHHSRTKSSFVSHLCVWGKLP